MALKGFKNYSRQTKKLIQEKLKNSITKLNNPLEMLRELLIYVENEKLILPSYTTLQDLVGGAIVDEEKRINKCITAHITKNAIKLIDALFSITENETYYDITILKRNPKNFNFKMIQAELEKHAKYYPLYKFAKRFLPKIGISEQNITYYASLVDHYEAQALMRFENEKRYFYLLCYAYHRFQKMNDQLIETLVHYVRSYNKEAKEYAKSHSGDISTDVKTKHGEAAKTLLYWYFDKTRSNLIFDEVQRQALEVLPEENIILVGEFLANDATDKKQYEWEFHDNNFQAMIKNIRPLINVLDFETTPENQELLEEFNFIKKLFENKNSLSNAENIPADNIPANIKNHLFEKSTDKKAKNKKPGKIKPYRYEFYVYDKLSKNLSSNKIYSGNTTQYKSFSDDIKLKKTKREKKQLLSSLDSPRLNNEATILLDMLEAEIEARIIETNENIKNGKNTHIKIKGSESNRTWTLPYKKKKDEYNNPFYDKLEIKNIVEIMIAVNDELHYMDFFNNIKMHYSKIKPDIKEIIACIIANATGLGTHKMGDSSDIPYTALRAIEKNLIRLETLRAASDCVCEQFTKLPIYPYYHLDNLLHGSADGQKFKTKRDTFNSRHSPKYYGLDKGVAPYTLGINYNAVNCIPDKGAHQHESHFLFELIQKNTSGVDLDRVSTDTEGSNQVMFALMYFANIDYTPCYRNLRKKTKKIYGFKNLHEYPQDYLIQPSCKINKNLIIEEWSNIQDIVMAVLSKETCVNVITRKLCSNELKDKTKRALWELNNILRSIYLLRYIDDHALRTFVRTALNRIEAYHFLRRNIGETNGSGFRGGSDVEVAVWNECARLVANVVMYYNAALLSKLMKIKENKGDVAAVELIIRLSPIASQHINFGGRYEFYKETAPINFDKLLAAMDKIDIVSKDKKKKMNH